MYVSTSVFQIADSMGPVAGELPPEVRSLSGREREVAAIVYKRGLATARDVEVTVRKSVRNATVRSMLNRLVHKRILLSQQCGGRGRLVYAPALTGQLAREIALRQFADDFCAGSLSFLSDDIAHLYASAPNLSEMIADFEHDAPVEVLAAAPRMRQIAMIIYQRGSASIEDIRAKLPVALSRTCVRTLTNRLGDRGIVKRKRGVRYSEWIYLPALITKKVRQLALMRLIEDRFDSSPALALQTVLQLAAQG